MPGHHRASPGITGPCSKRCVWVPHLCPALPWLGTVRRRTFPCSTKPRHMEACAARRPAVGGNACPLHVSARSSRGSASLVTSPSQCGRSPGARAVLQGAAQPVPTLPSQTAVATDPTRSPRAVGSASTQGLPPPCPARAAARPAPRAPHGRRGVCARDRAAGGGAGAHTPPAGCAH